MRPKHPSWRALALAAAGTTAALVARLVLIRKGQSEAAWSFARRAFAGDVAHPDEFAETWQASIERRLGAVETHLTDFEDRHREHKHG